MAMATKKKRLRGKTEKKIEINCRSKKAATRKINFDKQPHDGTNTHTQRQPHEIRFNPYISHKHFVCIYYSRERRFFFYSQSPNTHIHAVGWLVCSVCKTYGASIWDERSPRLATLSLSTPWLAARQTRSRLFLRSTRAQNTRSSWKFQYSIDLP